ncbi:twin-arginine translocase TatA/TatE family subunit [Kytococcus sedentarius]|uniref:twin-arginine translocase TatA/TatE family subunit n=1 Tax=Kytococcus sedentarius TaxID=1276 RepID=UPI0035BC20D1
MNIFGMSQWELLLILVVMLVLIGPDRLPGAIENLRRWIRQARDMANQAKGDLREQVGDDIDLDWRKWDPRQYNPKRIVREALMEDVEALNPFAQDDEVSEAGVEESRAAVAPSPGESAAPAGRRWGNPHGYDPLAPTPYDTDAT